MHLVVGHVAVSAGVGVHGSCDEPVVSSASNTDRHAGTARRAGMASCSPVRAATSRPAAMRQRISAANRSCAVAVAQ